MAIYDFPTRKELESLQVGDLALNCFGDVAEITEIVCGKEDREGKYFVLYYTKWSDRSSISMSRKEKTLSRTLKITRYHTSAELDEIEKRMRKEA